MQSEGAGRGFWKSDLLPTLYTSTRRLIQTRLCQQSAPLPQHRQFAIFLTRTLNQLFVADIHQLSYRHLLKIGRLLPPSNKSRSFWPSPFRLQVVGNFLRMKGFFVELGVLVLLSLLHSTLPYFITVDAHAEECFFDKVQNGTKLGKWWK